jgi:hypothetical protein
MRIQGELLLLTMQLKRHVAYQSEGGKLCPVNQSLRDEVPGIGSGFRELDTEIHRTVASLLKNNLF